MLQPVSPTSPRLSLHRCGYIARVAGDVPRKHGNLYWIWWSMTSPSRQLNLIRAEVGGRRGYDERQGRQTSERTSRSPAMFVYIHRLLQEPLASMYLLLEQTFLVLWYVCASVNPGRISGVLLWFTFACASGVSMYALGVLWEWFLYLGLVFG